jgi:hypothetical protein
MTEWILWGNTDFDFLCLFLVSIVSSSKSGWDLDFAKSEGFKGFTLGGVCSGLFGSLTLTLLRWPKILIG